MATADGSFNPRPCARGDDCKEDKEWQKKWFQSTPLREGRRFIIQAIWRSVNVSIHAPARGATKAQGFPEDYIIVSIHAPARGATSNT